MAHPAPTKKLKKTLTLADVYAIATGAMFSSGFFLLPGLATAEAGPSTVLAYLIAGILVLPAMFSQAELCTAMPRAGGTYYFLDRSLGPLAGTIGGFGTWLSLVFKSAFALVGMGAYLVFFVELPIKPVAIGLTVAFTVLNIVGVKETTGLQRFLVAVLVFILTFFVVQGLMSVFNTGFVTVTSERFTPFMPFGTDGLVATIGLVFVSYAGLTKVASISEEVQNPDRNIPLGMILSLLTATVVYVLGVYVVIAVLPAEELRVDLTPIATAAEVFMGWLPGGILGLSTGVILIVTAALAAFISTGNAGIMAASRYPLAMARDRLVWGRLQQIGRFETPTLAVLVTGAAMVLFIALFSAKDVAKLASAFNLLVFGLLNLAVIVMRESHIASYAPGYRSPLYPWMQIFGMLASVVLIATIGILSIAFTLFVILFGIGWYRYYARDHVIREGAIYHLFERLGQHRYLGLDHELHTILEEKGPSPDASFDRLVSRAQAIDISRPATFREITETAASLLSDRLEASEEELISGFLRKGWYEHMFIAQGGALPHYRIETDQEQELVLLRCRSGIHLAKDDADADGAAKAHAVTAPDDEESDIIYAFFFLVSSREHPGEHLRALANIASQVDRPSFLSEWRRASDEQALKEALLHYERYISLHVLTNTRSAAFIGSRVEELQLPAQLSVALVRREGEILIPGDGTVITEGDRLTVVGEPAGIKRFYELYGT